MGREELIISSANWNEPGDRSTIESHREHGQKCLGSPHTMTWLGHIGNI